MAREAIINLESGEVVNIHISWECPEGCITVPSDTAQIGDTYSEGVFELSQARQDELANVQAVKEQDAIELADRIEKLHADIAEIESGLDAVNTAIVALEDISVRQPADEAQLVIFKNAKKGFVSEIELLNEQLATLTEI